MRLWLNANVAECECARMLLWLNASVAEKTLIVLDLEVVQVVYEPAALCSETI